MSKEECGCIIVIIGILVMIIIEVALLIALISFKDDYQTYKELQRGQCQCVDTSLEQKND